MHGDIAEGVFPQIFIGPAVKSGVVVPVFVPRIRMLACFNISPVFLSVTVPTILPIDLSVVLVSIISTFPFIFSV
jgi:hypothetical protein